MNRVVYSNGNTIIGYINAGGCENDACLDAIAQGRPIHAIPAGFAVTLDDYHFATEADAVAVLEWKATDAPVRKLTAAERSATKDWPGDVFIVGPFAPSQKNGSTDGR